MPKKSPVLSVTISDVYTTINADLLYQVFSVYGSVVRVQVYPNKVVNAFVEMADPYRAAQARNKLNGAELYSGQCKMEVKLTNYPSLTVISENENNRDYTITPFGYQPGQFVQNGSVANTSTSYSSGTNGQYTMEQYQQMAYWYQMWSQWAMANVTLNANSYNMNNGNSDSNLTDDVNQIQQQQQQETNEKENMNDDQSKPKINLTENDIGNTSKTISNSNKSDENAPKHFEQLTSSVSLSSVAINEPRESGNRDDCAVCNTASVKIGTDVKQKPVTDMPVLGNDEDETAIKQSVSRAENHGASVSDAKRKREDEHIAEKAECTADNERNAKKSKL